MHRNLLFSHSFYSTMQERKTEDPPVKLPMFKISTQSFWSTRRTRNLIMTPNIPCSDWLSAKLVGNLAYIASQSATHSTGIGLPSLEKKIQIPTRILFEYWWRRERALPPSVPKYSNLHASPATPLLSPNSTTQYWLTHFMKLKRFTHNANDFQNLASFPSTILKNRYFYHTSSTHYSSTATWWRAVVIGVF